MAGKLGGWKTTVAVAIAGLLCMVLGVVLSLVVPRLIKDQIVQNVRIDPKSLAFEMWKEIPIPFYMSVYLFHVLNPKEVLNGEKPSLEERGPYVYREYRQKRNITFNENDTVSFLEYRSFVFQPQMSKGLETDYIMMPNILVLSASLMLEHKSSTLKFILSSFFSMHLQEAFINRTVGEILWGYRDPLLSLLNTFLPGKLPFKDKFGLFVQLNGSSSGLFNVFTGVKNFSKIHLVDKWNGGSKLNFWNSDQCNMINGTSGQMWAPFMTPEYKLEFYSPDACRSLSFDFERSGHFKGIPTFRFVAPKTLFANGTVYPPNEGFCPCMESGIQNMSACQFGAPFFLSQPHFLNADPVLLDSVTGLHPSTEEHSLFLEVHPVTGIPMNCSVKLQMSMYAKSVKGIRQTGNIKPVILPLLWFEQRGAMEGQTLSTFYNQLVLIPKLAYYIQYVLYGVSCLFILVTMVLLFKNQRTPSAALHEGQGSQSDELPGSQTPLLQDNPQDGQPTSTKS